MVATYLNTVYSGVLESVNKRPDSPEANSELTYVRIQKVKDLPQTPSSEILALYKKLSAKARHDTKPWIRRFEIIAAQQPQTIAVKSMNGQQLTYEELDQKGNQVAAFILDTLGATTNHIISIHFQRDQVETAIWFIAAQKAGIGLHQMEPNLSTSVLKKTLDDIGSDFLISRDMEFVGTLDGDSLRIVTQEELDSIAGSIEKKTAFDPDQNTPAFIISSSGTTGKAKIIRIPVRPLSDITEFAKEVLGADSARTVLQLAHKNFDAATFEYLFTLGNGATLLLVDDSISVDPLRFLDFLRNHVPETIVITPSHIQGILRSLARSHSQDALAEVFSCIGSMMLVGESFTPKLVQQLAQLGISRVVNGYGPSEIGIWASAAILFDETTCPEVLPPAIGYPVPGMDMRIMSTDDQNQWQLCGPEQKGYLFTNNGIVNVYSDAELNGKRYFPMPDPISGEEVCFYNTGDIVAMDKHGEVIFIGRDDNQVKINGQLVVTDHVSNLLSAAAKNLFPEQQIQIHVEAVENSEGSKFLQAYLIAENEELAVKITSAIMELAAEKIATYMKPTSWLWTKKFITKTNGKLDVATLRDTARPVRTHNKATAEPVSEKESYLLDLFKMMMNRSELGVLDQFFHQGLDSMTLMQIVTEAEHQGFLLSALEVYENPTVRSLAAHSTSTVPVSGVTGASVIASTCTDADILICDLTLERLDEAIDCLAETFLREPMTKTMEITFSEFKQFAGIACADALHDRQSLMALDQSSGEMVGCIIALDYLSPLPDDLELISDKFAPVITLLEQLVDYFKDNTDLLIGKTFEGLERGEVLHQFMAGIRKPVPGLFNRLVSAGERRAQESGYKHFIAEATTPFSQEPLTRHHGYQVVHSLVYEEFVFESQRIFVDMPFGVSECKLLVKSIE